ncbi:DUF6338 family protein [Jannaschia ovalis]|uniref:DUF6338 family protein n=1 Tax=Jannaschia ovalis TaxID=3038773 RepID=A0ABY8LD76_9RHOB|nr:DUF6338 family protein [Jannaschia sp. GRR-S6-38]WGH79096.1 DUF6338 family protein [Jannaschia sp. GRR-S6-38]
MGQLLSPDTFEFFARYLLAGYVVIIVRSRFVAGLRPKPAELVVEAIIFSLIIQVLVEAGAWLVSLVGFVPAKFPARVDLLLNVLVWPALLGALLGWNLSNGWNRAILRRLSLPVTHPVQRGHDFAFGQDRDPCFVIVTYEDGTIVRGWFGECSLASTDPDRSDLFLERVYSVDQDDQMIEQSPGRSALISLSRVRSIEFLDPEGDENGT